MKKNILLIVGKVRYSREYGTLGEIIKRLQEDENNNIYYLYCNGVLPKYCWISKHYKIGYCKRCKEYKKKIFKLTGLPEENILKMQKFDIPKFPKFKTIDELLKYNYENYNLGFSVASCLMTSTCDADVKVQQYGRQINKFLQTAYLTMKNILKYNEEVGFNEVHVFNGRFASTHPAVMFAEKYNLPYTTYEHGRGFDKMLVIKNTVPHDFDYLKSDIKSTWEKADNNKFDIAKNWFESRKIGSDTTCKTFTKKQKTNLLPKDFNNEKENIVIFNSSAHEVAAFTSWNLPFTKNENEVIERLLEHYKDDENKHFYLRIHPNLKRAEKFKIEQITQIIALKEKYKNLTVIGATEKIDTYALMKAASKVIVSYSTAGCEATYWEVPAICLKAPYEDLNCVYKANSFDELFELIDNKNLMPKSKENTFPFGYYFSVFGEHYRYYNAITRKDGEFMGMKFHDLNAR